MAASTITRAALTNGSTPWNVSTISSAVYDKIDEMFGGVGTYATLELGGALKINGALTQLSNDGGALGTSSLGWSDLFLASGGVINWNNGDVTLTHSTNTLTFGGAASGYIFNDGNVGIGVTPTCSLHVERAGTNNIISAIGQTGYEGVLYLSGAGSGKDTSIVVGNDRSLYVRTTSTATPTASGTARFGIHGSGNIAIGATARFYFDGTAGTGNTYASEESGDVIAFTAGGTVGLRVNTQGVNTVTGSQSVNSGVATTLFSVTTKGLYEVFAYYGGASAIYLSCGRVMSDGAGYYRATFDNGAGLTLSLSGSNVQATQSSGGALTIQYRFVRISD